MLTNSNLYDLPFCSARVFEEVEDALGDELEEREREEKVELSLERRSW